jgi:exosortase/archaeosortase family protein
MTIEDRAGPAVAGLPSLSTPDVSRLAVVGWLTAFTLFEWVRLKLETAGGWTTLYREVSALECVELVLLVRMVDLRARPSRIHAGEAAAILAGATFLTLFVTSRPVFSAGVLALFVLARFRNDPAYRIFAIGLFAFISQYLLLTGPFIWLHDAVATGDAWVTRHLLNLLGFGVTGSGTFILRPAADFGVDVIWGCSTSYVAAPVGAAFVIVVLALRRGWRRSDAGWLAGLLLATFGVNLLRLALTSVSSELHRFWHDGDGTAAFAVGYMLLVAAFSLLATREQHRGPATQ